MVKRTLVKCATKGCKRRVFPGREYCWTCWLKRRDKKIKRITQRNKNDGQA